MSFQAKIYKNKTYVNNHIMDISQELCSLLKPDFFNSKYHGSFEVERLHVQELLDSLNMFTSFSDIASSYNLQQRLEHYKQLHYILFMSLRVSYFKVKWEC